MIKNQIQQSSKNAYEQPLVHVLSVSASCIFQASGTTRANPDMDEETFDFDWQ